MMLQIYEILGVIFGICVTFVGIWSLGLLCAYLLLRFAHYWICWKEAHPEEGKRK